MLFLSFEMKNFLIRDKTSDVRPKAKTKLSALSANERKECRDPLISYTFYLFNNKGLILRIKIWIRIMELTPYYVSN